MKFELVIPLHPDVKEISEEYEKALKYFCKEYTEIKVIKGQEKIVLRLRRISWCIVVTSLVKVDYCRGGDFREMQCSENTTRNLY